MTDTKEDELKELSRDELLLLTRVLLSTLKEKTSVNISSLKIPPLRLIKQQKQIQDLFSGFEGKIVYEGDPDYEKARKQYATTSYPKQQMSPYVILYCENDNDVKIGINGAVKGDFKVVVRSGGHQYSGLSSDSDKYVQLDLSKFDFATYDSKTNIATVGVGCKLRKVTNFMDEHNVAIPSGQCYKVAIGGHVQTGGWGNILRSYGLTLDYVVGFDIILSNGQKKLIRKPETLEERKDDKKDTLLDSDLFWAVLGGNPQSFGVVLCWYFKPIQNDLHPNSYGLNIYWSWSKDTYTKIITTLKEISRKLPPDYDFMLTVGRITQLHDFPMILLNCCYGNVKGKLETVDKKWFDKFKKISFPLTVGEGKHTISHMMRKMFRVNSRREYDCPYVKSLRGTFVDFDDSFPAKFAAKLDKVLKDLMHFRLNFFFYWPA